MNKRKIFYYAVSIIITIAVFYYIFSTISFEDVINQIRLSNMHAIAGFVCLSLIGNFSRAWRYQILLAQGGYKASSGTLFLIVLVRNLCADLLPAKIGSAVYILLVNKKLGVNLVACTSSFMLAFIFDTIAIAPLVLLAAWEAFGSNQNSLIILIVFGLGVAFCFLVFLLQLKNILLISINLTKKLPLASTFKDKLTIWTDQVVKEIDRARENRVYFPVFLLSLLVRICKYGSLYLLLYAFIEPLGNMVDKISIGGAFLGIFSSELAASLPISGIAGFGAYEGAWSFTFQLLGLPEALANVTAVAHHLFTQAYGYLIGALAMLALIILPIKKAYPQFNLFRKNAFYLGFLVLSLLTIIGPLTLINIPKIQKKFFELRYGKNQVSYFEIASELNAINLPVNARILFDSTRGGTFGIHSLDPFTGEVTIISDDPNVHEIYGSISPNAELITYSIPESLAQEAKGSVWLMHRDGSNKQKIADNALFSSFSADGSKIFYEQRRKAVFSYNLITKEKIKLFPTKEIPFPKKAAVVKPQISGDQKWLSFTSNHPDRWYTWYVNLETGEKIQGPAGCQPVWQKNTSEPIWVKTSGAGAKAGSGIYALNLINKTERTIEDQDKPWGHEYFPSLDSSDQFLTYSACPHYQHSHADSNYQIHLKGLNSGKTIRLQFDEYTNNWPKLYYLY